MPLPIKYLEGTPVYRSRRKGKKYYVIQRDPNTGKNKEIHFGARNYRIAPGTKKGDRYCSRSSGIKGTNDPMSPNYWSRLNWECVGKRRLKYD